MTSIVRTESRALATSPEVRADIARTIGAYRRAVRAISSVLMTHWPELQALTNKCQAVESLFHATARRPAVKYPVLDRMLGKMPSSLRRAAIEHAVGAVSSFQSNWENFLDGQMGGREREAGARSPRMGQANVFPSLYGGNMVLYGAGLRSVRIKLLGADGQWRFSEPLALKGRFKRVDPRASALPLSPSLVLCGERATLACPVKLSPPRPLPNKSFGADVHRVCSVDVGINTAATAAIVDTTGTVIARKFFTCGRHNDRRDALAQEVADRQARSGGLLKGERHSVALHRRIQGLSLDAARRLASDIAAFAAQHGARAFVVEDLKGWRPKGPSRAQRKRFHRFQHRALVKALAYKAQELGARWLEVFARGTSRWAYDGSGVVVRDRHNARLATFSSGKRYNADLNGALNIAARGLALPLGLIAPATDKQAATGKSPGAVARMPLVLAHVWAHALRCAGPLTSRPDGRRALEAGIDPLRMPRLPRNALSRGSIHAGHLPS